MTRCAYYKTSSEEKYILDKSCDGGSMIMNRTECKSACNDLGIPVFGKLKDRRPCFQGGNGMCMQNSGYGPKSKMLCTKKDTAEGNLYTVLYHNVRYKTTRSEVLFFYFLQKISFS